MVAGSYGKSMFSLVNHQTIFQGGCTVLPSQQHCMRATYCSTSSPAFGVIRVSQVCSGILWFYLHFPGDVWCGAYSHMLICHLCISLVRCLLRSLAHFLKKSNCLFSYYWVLRVLCIFWIIVFYQMYLL